MHDQEKLEWQNLFFLYPDLADSLANPGLRAGRLRECGYDPERPIFRRYAQLAVADKVLVETLATDHQQSCSDSQPQELTGEVVQYATPTTSETLWAQVKSFSAKIV